MNDEYDFSDTNTIPLKTKVFLACLIACGLITAGAILRECFA